MSGYDGHRTRSRRRMTASQARPASAPVDDQVDLDDPIDLDEPDDLAATGRDRPVAQPPPPSEPALPDARAFVEALAPAVSGVPLAEHTPAQLDHLRAVLAVVAPGLTLTPDHHPEETTVPTAAAPAPAEPDADDTAAPPPDEDAPPESEVDDGQAERAELAAAFAALAAERRATAVLRAEHDQLLAEAADPVRATARAAHAAAAARQQVADEAAIADLREALAFAQRQTASAVAHRLVAVARTVLTTHGLPATQAAALALISPELREDVPLTEEGQLDATTAHATLDAAARARLAAPR